MKLALKNNKAAVSLREKISWVVWGGDPLGISFRKCILILQTYFSVLKLEVVLFWGQVELQKTTLVQVNTTADEFGTVLEFVVFWLEFVLFTWWNLGENSTGSTRG